MAPRRVTLTFDNGPTPAITEQVLEILDREGIRSTFFVIGQKLRTPAAVSLARDAHSAGHWIGNHTFTHSVALGDRPDADYAAREIGDTQDRIGDLSHPDKLFRPYGNSGLVGRHLLSRAAISYLLTHQFRTIIWNFQRLADVGVIYEQDYPEDVTLTRAGQIVGMQPSYIVD